jgi:ubiquitin-large subunit ribosomal protein L40e
MEEVEEIIPSDVQRLFLDLKQLEVECKLEDYNIQKERSLVLMLPFDALVLHHQNLLNISGCCHSRMQIFVKTHQCNIIALDVDGSETIHVVKRMIEVKKKIPSGVQRLFLAGKQLKDERTLAYYNIQMQSLLDLMLPFLGGRGGDDLSGGGGDDDLEMEDEADRVDLENHQGYDGKAKVMEVEDNEPEKDLEDKRIFEEMWATCVKDDEGDAQLPGIRAMHISHERSSC